MIPLDKFALRVASTVTVPAELIRSKHSVDDAITTLVAEEADAASAVAIFRVNSLVRSVAPMNIFPLAVVVPLATASLPKNNCNV